MKQLSPETIELIEEIFDSHSYHINDDLDSLQYIAGSSVIVNKIDFKKAVAEILSKIKGSEWVSCKDRLPELPGDLYAMCNFLVFTNGYVTQLSYRRDEVRKQILYRWHSAYGLHHGEVTHWMPLPTPPINQ